VKNEDFTDRGDPIRHYRCCDTPEENKKKRKNNRKQRREKGMISDEYQSEFVKE
jgi:hypothetical protein